MILLAVLIVHVGVQPRTECAIIAYSMRVRIAQARPTKCNIMIHKKKILRQMKTFFTSMKIFWLKSQIVMIQK